MASVTVSPKFQVVIPRAARESLHIRPGQKLQVLVYNGQLRFIPVRSYASYAALIVAWDLRSTETPTEFDGAP